MLFQGFYGKPGAVGPQGSVGMYVSDASAGVSGINQNIETLFFCFFRISY